MVITFGYDQQNGDYLVKLYVNGFTDVALRARNIRQLLNLINMMKQMFPISIAFQHDIPMQKKQDIITAIQQNIVL